MGRVLRAAMESRDLATAKLEHDGVDWYLADRPKRTIMTVVGRVTYGRSRYRRRSEPRSVMPVDEELELVVGSMTPPVGKVVTMLMAQMPPREVQAILAELGPLYPSASRMSRLVLAALGKIRAEEEGSAAAASRCVSLAGVVVPHRGAGGVVAGGVMRDDVVS